jgi:hypothetical protein
MTLRKGCLTAGFVIAVLAAAISPAAAKSAAAAHELTAKVVAVDLAAKSIRIDTGTGPSQVLFAVGKAAESLDELPAGEMFKLTVRDSDDGKRREVVTIKRAKNALKP